MRAHVPPHPDPSLGPRTPETSGDPSNAAPGRAFRLEHDESGRPVEVHVGMNRKQRRALAKQRELELRRHLRSIAKSPERVKALARAIASRSGG